MRKAAKQCPKECIPWFIGDLNVNLDSPSEDERGMDIAKEVDAMDVVCTSWIFPVMAPLYAGEMGVADTMPGQVDFIPPRQTTFFA